MNLDRIIVLGRGFLGQAFEREGFRVWRKDRFYLHPNNNHREKLNVLNNYDIIINCLGKSNTRWCEKQENWREVFFSNGEIPKILSDYCRRQNKKLVHISTGCLYDDSNGKEPWTEEDSIVPHCDYTVSKRVGEKNCNPEKDLILRPRLYFGDFENRNNLLCKLPKFSKYLTELNSYTSVHTIVEATTALLEANQAGVFNVANDGDAEVIELASWIGLSGEEITGKELREQEKLYLVNNTMDISKLQKFYNPQRLKYEVMRCWEKLKRGEKI